MPRFLVQLHEDVFYDVVVEADDEDDAYNKAVDAVSNDSTDQWRVASGIEMFDTEEPIKQVSS